MCGSVALEKGRPDTATKRSGRPQRKGVSGPPSWRRQEFNRRKPNRGRPGGNESRPTAVPLKLSEDSSVVNGRSHLFRLRAASLRAGVCVHGSRSRWRERRRSHRVAKARRSVAGGDSSGQILSAALLLRALHRNARRKVSGSLIERTCRSRREAGRLAWNGRRRCEF